MRRAAAALCCLILLAACGDDEPVSATTGVASSPPTTTATTVLETSVVPLGVPPCELVGAEEVASAIGMPVVAGLEEPPLSCRFDLTEVPGVHVAVIIEDGAGRLGGAAAIFDGYRDLLADGEADEIPGLGSSAVYAPGFRGLAVDAGDGRFFAVAIGGSYQALDEPGEALVLIAEAVLAGL